MTYCVTFVEVSTQNLKRTFRMEEGYLFLPGKISFASGNFCNIGIGHKHLAVLEEVYLAI